MAVRLLTGCTTALRGLILLYTLVCAQFNSVQVIFCVGLVLQVYLNKVPDVSIS